MYVSSVNTIILYIIHNTPFEEYFKPKISQKLADRFARPTVFAPGRFACPGFNVLRAACPE